MPPKKKEKKEEPNQTEYAQWVVGALFEGIVVGISEKELLGKQEELIEKMSTNINPKESKLLFEITEKITAEKKRKVKKPIKQQNEEETEKDFGKLFNELERIENFIEGNDLIHTVDKNILAPSKFY